MKEQRLPKRWDEQCIKRLIVELNARTDEEWIAANEAAAADAGDADAEDLLELRKAKRSERRKKSIPLDQVKRMLRAGRKSNG